MRAEIKLLSLKVFFYILLNFLFIKIFSDEIRMRIRN